MQHKSKLVLLVLRCLTNSNWLPSIILILVGKILLWVCLV